jgi:molecular chaperone GrpE
LEAAEKQRDDYLTLLRTTQADVENYQKRLWREMAEERRYAHAPFATALLPILFNLQRALDAARQAGEQGPLTQGVALVQAQLLDTLARFGVKPIEAEGRAFDPHLHEAVSQEDRADVVPGTMIRVLEPGYVLHERVLRPAKVVVASSPNR